jgi:hypothetical protein
MRSASCDSVNGQEVEMSGTYVIRQERPGEDGPSATTWLTRITPPLWGDRAEAVKFPSKAEAQRVAAALAVYGVRWSVEPA